MNVFFLCYGAMASMELRVGAVTYLNYGNLCLIELWMGTDGAKTAVALDGAGGAMRAVDCDNSEKCEVALDGVEVDRKNCFIDMIDAVELDAGVRGASKDGAWTWYCALASGAPFGARNAKPQTKWLFLGTDEAKRVLRCGFWYGRRNKWVSW